MRAAFPPIVRSVVLAACAAASLAGSSCNKELVCASDQAVCGGTCTAVKTDPRNCGGCGASCAAGEQCSAGLCRCANGRADCGGACVDVATDPAHCGACSVACGAAQLCTTNGAGQTACASSCALLGQTSCGRACVDLQTNADACGACGRTCGTNERCVTGRCVAELYVSCFNTGDVREATAALAPAGLPVPAGPGTSDLAWVGDALYASSGLGAETLWRLQLDPPAVRAAPILVTSAPQPDLEGMAAHGGLLYLSQASTGHLLVATADGGKSYPVPLSSAGAPSPQGIAFQGDKAYVALNGSDEVVVLDVSGAAACLAGTPGAVCPSIQKRIDLSPLASPTAHARPSRFALDGKRLFVTLWNLDDSYSVPASSTGRLAVLDTDLDALDAHVSSTGVAGLVDLGPGCLDPADAVVQGRTLYVSCGAFDYSGAAPTIRGAGVARVDLAASQPALLPLLAAPTSSAPGRLAFCNGAGYVADRNSGLVFHLDSASGTHGGVELCPPANGYAFVADLTCGPTSTSP
jgi:hypothetical protein